VGHRRRQKKEKKYVFNKGSRTPPEEGRVQSYLGFARKNHAKGCKHGGRKKKEGKGFRRNHVISLAEGFEKGGRIRIVETDVSERGPEKRV